MEQVTAMSGKTPRRTVRLASVFALAAIAAGCASNAPRDTTFVWKLQSDRAVRHVRTARAEPHVVSAQESDVVPRLKPDIGDASLSAPASDQATVERASYAPDAAQFTWPLRGRILADFGPTASGGRNDGINIAAKAGAPIRAAADGKVTYTGSELKGYGNLVLIQHDDGYVTAYAHAASIAVGRGDRVQKGQVIAYAGETGDVAEPQLHFEIRHGVEPVNPRTLLVARE